MPERTTLPFKASFLFFFCFELIWIKGYNRKIIPVVISIIQTVPQCILGKMCSKDRKLCVMWLSKGFL